MIRLPPPQTFAEGQRLVYGLLAASAGIFCGLCAVAMIALLMWGGWSPTHERSIVAIFGWSLGGFIAAMVAVSSACSPAGRSAASACPPTATAPALKPTAACNDPCADYPGATCDRDVARSRDNAARPRSDALGASAPGAVPSAAAAHHPPWQDGTG